MVDEERKVDLGREGEGIGREFLAMINLYSVAFLIVGLVEQN